MHSPLTAEDVGQGVLSAVLGGGGSSAGGFQPGVIHTQGGGQIAYDTPLEQQNAMTIADTIAEGGVNPETGDPWIVAGPNALSAADEGLFGFGSDYNQEFVENYDAQSAHAEANPTGQTTGTPLYDQGYVGISDPVTNTVGGIVNTSLPGQIVTGITGEPILPDVSSLLPPEESFSNYNDNDDDDPWSSGIHYGGSAQTETDLITSDISDDDFWNEFESGGSSGSDDDDSSSDSSGCVVATHALSEGIDINRDEAVKWCISNLHGHWIGETIRKGYRHLGRKKIAEGKASNHYDEFRNYVDYATSSDKSLSNAWIFYKRNLQFFTVGLFRRIADGFTSTKSS